MKLSLKAQLTLFLLTFISILVGQVYFAKTNQSGLIDTFSSFQKTITEEKLVRELERDVLDLQRQVLIFKDTGSQSSVKRFDVLIIDVKAKLEQIKSGLNKNTITDDAVSKIEAMQQHINDYNENFSSVVQGRRQRDTYFEDGIIADFEALFSSKSFQTAAEKKDTLLAQLYSAENVAYRYLQQPRSQLKRAFLDKLNDASLIVQSINADPKDKDFILTSIEIIDQKFIQLTHVTQGYIYLVNVVMAGSANEFLYLSQAMSKESALLAAETDTKIQENIDASRTQMNLSSFVGIFITLLLVVIAASRIFIPLRAITQVFQRLANDDSNVEVPFALRKDEIGKLARAATVFSNKNLQTKELLEQSQQLNSEQEALNKKLAESKFQAEQANASKSIFLANMSHEIRTPMNGIIGLVDISLKSELPPPIRDNLEKVAYSSQILMNVIKDILDFSKIEAGKLEIENSLFSFSQLFDSLPAFTVIPCAEKRLNVELFVDPLLPNKAIGDPLRISQVILNLTNNAIKFTQKGSIKISFYRRASLDKNAFILELKVEDTGVGISKEKLQEIFMPFTQGDNSTSRKYGGTGLGLSIVKQLTLLMEGDVSATSVLNEGSIFTCSFKLLEDDQTPLSDGIHKLKLPIVYFCQEPPLLHPEYAQLISTRITHEVIDIDSDMSIERLEESFYIIDIGNVKQAMLLTPLLQQLYDAGKRFGCITTTHPINLRDRLQGKWNCPVLSHPFTPKDINALHTSLQDNQDAQHNSPLIAGAPNESKHTNNTPAQFKGHILLAEDNAINQMLMGEMLKSIGLTYEVAHDGSEAVQKIKEGQDFDLVLMDVQMPIMDGIEATKLLRQNGNVNIPIIGVSAHAMQEDYDLAKASGMTDYLTKPIMRETLLITISKYLAPQH